MDEFLLLESALFSSGKPLSINELAEAMDMEPNAVRKHIKKLRGLYRNRNTSIEVAKVGSKYCVQVKEKFREHASRFSSTNIPRRLLKSLTLIAYHQPIKQSTLVKIIGPKIYKEVKELRELGLIHYKRSGHTKIISTTKKFPEYFGIATTTKEGIKKWLREKMGISDGDDDLAEPLDDAETVDDGEPTDDAATIDDGEPTDGVETADDAAAIDDGEPTDGMETADNAGTADDGKSTDDAAAVDEGEPVDGVEMADDAAAVDDGEPVDGEETADDSAAVDEGEPVDDMEPTDDAETADGANTTNDMEPMNDTGAADDGERIDDSVAVDDGEPIGDVDSGQVGHHEESDNDNDKEE